MAPQPGFLRLAWRSGLVPAGLFFVLLGGLFAGMGGVRLVAELRYRNDGVRVEATVLSKSVERASGRESHTRYLVTYRFTTAAGETVESRGEVDADRWEDLKPGDPLEIVYLPASPAASRGADDTGMPLALGFTAIGAFVMLAGGIIILTGARRALRHLRIARGGVTAEATVIRHLVSGKEHCMQYRYRDLHGVEHTYTEGSLSAEDLARWKVGDKGIVRYDPDDPRRSVWLGGPAQGAGSR